MAQDNHIRTYTALDIEKYHKGQMSPADMHAMEKAALDDPFLADAIEGYSTPGVQVSTDIAELKKRLEQKTEQAKVIPIQPAGNRKYPFLRIAAMIAVLLVAGYLITRFTLNKKDDGLADRRETTTIGTPGAKKDTSTTPVFAPSTQDQMEDDQKNTATAIKPAVPGNQGPVHNPAKLITTEVATAPDRDGGGTVPTVSRSINADSISFDDKLAKQEVAKDMAADKAIAMEQEKKAKSVSSGTIDAAKRADNNQRALAMNTFRGRVTDQSNNGIPFANVTAIQDNAGTYTDANGYFNFRSPDTVLDVQVRSIGFENNLSRMRNVSPTNRVVLSEDRSMNEVVISNNRPNTEARARRSNVTLEEPEPADGWTNYDAYLANNLNVPDEYRSKPSSNQTVEVSFEVDKNGEPVNIRIERSLCKKCDNEAIRLIKEGPKWKRNASPTGRTTVTINF